eukprot:COSAG01_NODE_880_length_12937_cov_265.873968_13_plen_68_part_00
MIKSPTGLRCLGRALSAGGCAQEHAEAAGTEKPRGDPSDLNVARPITHAKWAAATYLPTLCLPGAFI